MTFNQRFQDFKKAQLACLKYNRHFIGCRVTLLLNPDGYSLSKKAYDGSYSQIIHSHHEPTGSNWIHKQPIVATGQQYRLSFSRLDPDTINYLTAEYQICPITGLNITIGFYPSLDRYESIELHPVYLSKFIGGGKRV